MATGWRRQNGLELNVGMEADPVAIDRGAEMYLDLDAMRLRLNPWRDGSGDSLTMRPVFPAGTSVVVPEGGTVRDGLTEVAHGWRADLQGGALDGVVLRLMDLQGDKVPEALDDFLAPGLALIYTFPVGSVPLTGEWNAKRIRFGGIADDCTFAIQPDESGNPEVTQPKWVPGSIAIYHAAKKNDGGFRKYGTGKFAHLPRPLMVGRNATGITGYAFGDYVEVSHGVFDKIFDMDAILAAPSQTLTKFGIGQPTQVHISADLGYTTRGASSDIGVTNNRGVTSNGYTASEDGTVTMVSIGTNVAVTDGDTPWSPFIYEGAESQAGDDLIASDETATGDPREPFSATWFDIEFNGSILDGVTYWFGGGNRGGNTVTPAYDTVGGVNYGFYTSGIVPAPDPSNAPNVQRTGRESSVYLTYDAAATTPVTTNTTVTPSSQVKGVDVALSADINTASETISDAEYFVGAVDPGEGSGTSMALGAGTTSREATATIDTSAITSGAHTVSVRGYDAVNGWGAVDTDTLTITLPIITGLTATPGDTVVNLTWDDFAGSASGTRIIWDTVSPPVANDIDTFGLAYEHTGRTNGVEYFYTVSAKDGGGVGTASDIVSAVPSEPAIVVIGGEGIADPAVIIGNGGLNN